MILVDVAFEEDLSDARGESKMDCLRGRNGWLSGMRTRVMTRPPFLVFPRNWGQ
jgi:hypothetical protein